MSKWHGGKGDSPRKGADLNKYESGWEKIFGNKDSDDEYDNTLGNIHENGIKPINNEHEKDKH